MAEESSGTASLHMAMGYVDSLGQRFQALDNKASVIMAGDLVIYSLIYTVISASSITLWATIAPAIVAVAALALGMRALQPQMVGQFVDPLTLINDHRESGSLDHDIAWSLVESLSLSAGELERHLFFKARLIRWLQWSLAALVVSASVSVAVAALAA